VRLRFYRAVHNKKYVLWDVTTCTFVALYDSFGVTCIFHLKGRRSVLQMEATDTSAILVSTHSNIWTHIPKKLIMVVVILDEYHWICNVMKLYPIMKTHMFSKHPLEWMPDPVKLKLYTDNSNKIITKKFFDFHMSVHRKYISKVRPKTCNFSQSIYFYKLLYMFQAVPPPIIRSTKLYIQRQLLSNQYSRLLLSWMRWNSVEFHLIHDSSRQQYWFDNTWRCMYSFVLLMMGEGTAWNM
jgi:hypothetical protein